MSRPRPDGGHRHEAARSWIRQRPAQRASTTVKIAVAAPIPRPASGLRWQQSRAAAAAREARSEGPAEGGPSRAWTEGARRHLAYPLASRSTCAASSGAVGLR